MTPEEVLPALASVTALADKVTECSAGSGKWVNFPLCSGVLMQLLFYRVSGSGFASVSGKKKKEKKPLYFYFASSEAGQSVQEGTSLCLVPAWLAGQRGGMQGASRKSWSPSQEIPVLLWERVMTRLTVQKTWSCGPSTLANHCTGVP